MDKRKIFLILGLVLLLALAGTVFVYTKKSKQPVVTQKIPEIKKFIEDTPISATASFNGEAIWYFTEEGRLFRQSLADSSKDEYSLPPVKGLLRVAWPSSGNDFISVVATSTGEIKKYYNSNLKRYIDLPLGVRSFAWMPDGKRIVYIFEDSAGKQLLSVSDADGSGFRNIATLTKPGLMVKVSSNGQDAILIPSDGGMIFKINLENAILEPLIEEGKNTAAFWLPDGNRFIFNQVLVGNDYPRVLMYNITTRKIVDLGVMATTDRMAYDKEGKSLFVAVPKKGSGGDAFVKINLDTFAQETYFEPTVKIKVKDVIPASGTLYFMNTADSKMYFIDK